MASIMLILNRRRRTRHLANDDDDVVACLCRPCRWKAAGRVVLMFRYRTRCHVFLRIMQDVENFDPWFSCCADATGKMGLSPLQKCVAAIRILAYGVPAGLDDLRRTFFPLLLGEGTQRRRPRRGAALAGADPTSLPVRRPLPPLSALAPGPPPPLREPPARSDLPLRRDPSTRSCAGRSTGGGAAATHAKPASPSPPAPNPRPSRLRLPSAPCRCSASVPPHATRFPTALACRGGSPPLCAASPPPLRSTPLRLPSPLARGSTAASDYAFGWSAGALHMWGEHWAPRT
ncbi:hypothetical protein BAE44_0013279 [Dichanthelium oligosanthes]|uniref:Uncharacterized protein n=1 Tax=Dichanthelium oligosanthes TaxID=888268 RepID=A0A1E5VKP8_9POAL|nr:hypothetical protein BAE44_0013279 [Dichanthelium oligosanthes]